MPDSPLSQVIPSLSEPPEAVDVIRDSDRQRGLSKSDTAFAPLARQYLPSVVRAPWALLIREEASPGGRTARKRYRAWRIRAGPRKDVRSARLNEFCTQTISLTSSARSRWSSPVATRCVQVSADCVQRAKVSSPNYRP